VTVELNLLQDSKLAGSLTTKLLPPLLLALHSKSRRSATTRNSWHSLYKISSGFRPSSSTSYKTENSLAALPPNSCLRYFWPSIPNLVALQRLGTHGIHSIKYPQASGRRARPPTKFKLVGSVTAIL
jgi:hypothetical protein